MPYYLRNVKCQRMLIITIYKMSIVIAKSHHDHQCSQSEQLWGAVRKNIISDRFSTKTAISAHI